MRIISKIALLAGAFLSTMGLTLATDPPIQLNVTSPASARWVDCPHLPPGCKMIVLHGDPAQPGEYAVRFKYPAGFRIAPHFHPADEHATLVSGGPFHVAIGDSFDDKAPSGRTLHAGDFVVMPAGLHHFAWAEGESFLQVHGIGPFKRNYVSPADEPSKAPK